MGEQCSCQHRSSGAGIGGHHQRVRWFRRGDQIVVVLREEEPAYEQEVVVVGTTRPTAVASAAVQAAIRRGVSDENQLTDIAFYTLHPDRRGRPLQKGEQLLIQEWLGLRGLVRSLLTTQQPGAPPAAPPAHAVVPVGQPGAQLASTTSGVEAAGNTTHIIPCIQRLQDQGRSIKFVQRYLRDLTRAEVAALHTAGFQIVSCHEEGSHQNNPTQMKYFTRAQGAHDGRRAFTLAQAVGQPADTPIYFAVDTDPDPRQRQAILDYFQGIADGQQQYVAAMRAQNKPVVSYAIGVYGSGCVLSWCQAQGIATWFWQAFAPGWCNNRKVWPGVNIHTSGRDIPPRCGWRLGHLEGWGNEGGW